MVVNCVTFAIVMTNMLPQGRLSRGGTSHGPVFKSCEVTGVRFKRESAVVKGNSDKIRQMSETQEWRGMSLAKDATERHYPGRSSGGLPKSGFDEIEKVHLDIPMTPPARWNQRGTSSSGLTGNKSAASSNSGREDDLL